MLTVIETVREKFTCRDCEAISQAPAPFHTTPRGFIGPHLLATIVFDKFGMHSPLNVSGYTMRRVTGAANIRRNIWPRMAAFYRATATMASSRSLWPRQRRFRSPLPFAIPIRVGNSLRWPISRRMPAITSAKASRSRRSHWRPSNVMTRCSKSNAGSTA